MAVYAAMVDRMDQGIGRVVATLKAKGELENTLICFLSDNGACAESYNNILNVSAGPADSATGVWLPWANASNTPFRLFKHWPHEGGCCTPFITHWPARITTPRTERRYFAHVKDLMATCLDLADAPYPTQNLGSATPHHDSVSLLPNLLGEASENPEDLIIEHKGNRLLRSGDWKLVSYYSEPRGYRRHDGGLGQRTAP